MPTERRIRADHPNYELRHARVRVDRKDYECIWCRTACDWPTDNIKCGDTYARISETRLPVCAMHFTEDDIVEVTK